MSAKGKISKKDWKSVLRHTVMPLVFGCGAAALEAVLNPAGFTIRTVLLAAGGAAAQGLWRLKQRYSLETPEPPTQAIPDVQG